MGNGTRPEEESLERVTRLVDKTQSGAVKHNGSEGLGTGTTGTWRREIDLPNQETGRARATVTAEHMANDLLTPEMELEAAGAGADDSEVVRALDAAFGFPVEEKPIWTGLYESLRDLLFPPKLPPLELTSKPIPVPDRMAVKRNPWAVGISTAVNLAILAVLLFFGLRRIINIVKPPTVAVTPLHLTDIKMPKAAEAAGGGGGSPDKSEAIKGRVPPRAQAIVTVPKMVLPPAPTIDVQKEIKIPDDPSLPNFGMSDSPNVKLASGGNGAGLGMGSGSGNGYGAGSGGNYGGGVYRVGGGVSAPSILHSVDAQFTDEARRNKYQGVCIVEILVDAQGSPHNPRVVRALGMGLDENAVKAIMQYKFRPGMRNGKPVAVWPVDVEIDFHLY